MNKPTLEQAIQNVNKWITIKNTDSEESTIDIDGIIGEDWFGEGENTTKAIRNKLKEIGGLKAKKITVNINSLGGSVTHGIGIHDVLAAHKAEIETNVTGMTASAATIIAQAGDTRKMSDNALYLIHQPWSVFISNVKELESNLEDMRKVNDTLIRIYTKRSGQPESKIRELMDEANGNGKWIDAEEAKEMGLIDEVYEPMKAAASLRDQIMSLSKGPESFIEKLPEIPNSKIEMKTNVTQTEGSEAAMSVTENEKKGLSALIEAAKKFFGSEEEEQDETVEETEETAEEEQAEETAEEESEEETSEEEESEEEQAEESTNNEVQSAASNIEARLSQLEAENAELQSRLARADAKSTKPSGPEGNEGSGTGKSPEQEMLDADLTKLRATWNGEE